ncbi:MAG: extracellular solute-binding protein [Acetobacteraceae bacterium]|nr:extracellular solute-binding protein [Acetobacteraceae bacterium]MBV8573617.1 extracellular solute-binding protein [Acetobacteraceae bacterium]
MADRISRRRALELSVAATALPLLHVRTAGAAGKLSVGFWDHWVPDGNKVMQKQVDAWANANKVDVRVDFITVNGNKLLMTGVAEAQARTGHDIMTFLNWDMYNVARYLAPVEDVMQRLIAKHGPATKTAEYLGRSEGAWLAVPTSSGTQTKPPCARISLMKKYGVDVQAMYPARPEKTAPADEWTYDSFLRYAEAAHKDGKTFGMGLGGGECTDSTDQVGAMFRAFGAALVDGKGNIQVHSDAVQQVLEYSAKLVRFMPDDALIYDDASNNRALISGQSALIFNPPSAWAVAKRDAPTIASDCWTFPPPAGPKGRFVGTVTWFWGIWSFSKNQSAAKDLIEYLMQREQIEERDNVVEGYDLPPFDSMNDFKIWEKVEPPLGTVYNYPIRPWHGSEPNITASEAPPDIAVQIYRRAVHSGILGRMKQGQSIKQAVDWAQSELEGFTR